MPWIPGVKLYLKVIISRKYFHSNEGLGGKNGFVEVKQGIRGDRGRRSSTKQDMEKRIEEQ